MKHKILIVDDEPANLRVLERLFQTEYEPHTAESGIQALELLGRHDFALIISDQRMPGMTGIEFLKKAALLRHQTVRIILTGHTDVGDLIDAINSGVVYKYVVKPWINADILDTVRQSVGCYEIARKQHFLVQKNEHLETRLRVTVNAFVEALTGLGEREGSMGSAHCRRVSAHAKQIAIQLGVEPDDIEILMLASALHEVPNHNLPFDPNIKKTALTPALYRTTRAAYERGLGLISAVPDLEAVTTIIRYQYEYYDGNGFFDGLDGEKIPLLSRILAVANAFDEIASNQDDKLMTHKVASELRTRSGSQLDPRVVECFVNAALDESPIYPSYSEYMKAESRSAEADDLSLISDLRTDDRTSFDVGVTRGKILSDHFL